MRPDDLECPCAGNSVRKRHQALAPARRPAFLAFSNRWKIRATALPILGTLLAGSALAAGTGLTGQYYSNTAFTALATTRVDTNVNFTWGTNVPPGTTLASANNFGVIWTGQIEPEFSELYTFFMTADDMGRLWVDDQCLVARTFFQGTGEMRGQIRLKAGHRVNIRLEYADLGGGATAKLEWASPSRARTVIPMAQLYPTTETRNGGSLMLEHWTGISGAAITSLTANASYPSRPAMRDFITSFECLATNLDENLGTRVTGFLRAPTNGTFTFAVSGDESVQLFLSPTTNPASKVLIASVTNATGFRQWTLQTNQISAPQSLAAGQRCYVELLHKESTNADHWSVGWKQPGETNFSIVPGTVLMQPQANTTQPASSSLFNTLATEHPYLGVSRARFTWLKQQYQSPTASAAKSRAQAIVSSANGDLTAALDAGRWGRDRLQRLAVAWWLTGNSNYAESAWANINNVVTNGDWADPWKGETDGYVALGYDWLHPYWSQARKATMTNAMIAKGFGPSWTDSYGNNIGIIINSGHLMACLAVGRTNEAAAEPKLNTAISRLLSKINKWEPNDGAWYEGTDYGIFTKWGFGQGMLAMENALGSTWSLGRTRGVGEAAREPLYIASNTRQRFTFSDVGTGSENAIGWENWWARRFDAPEGFDFSRLVGSSALNALLVPETTISPAASGLPPDRAFRGPANATQKMFQEVVTLRENWSDTKATFVGAMGGTGSYDHDMLQSGTFQLCARGVRWFKDLSSEDYGVPNHNVTNPNTHPNRWDYYRNRAEGHNTLVINPSYGPDRRWDAPIAPLMHFQSAPNGQRSFAVWDLTPTMTGGVTRVHRGIQLLGNRRQVLVQDEIVTPAPSIVWWFAHCAYGTSSIAIAPDGLSVMLTQGSERLWGSILSGGGVFSNMPAKPLPTSPNPAQNGSNSFPKLAIKLTGVTNRTLAVWFVPLGAGETPPTNPPTLSALSQWNLVTMNEAPVARDALVTCTNNVSVDVDLHTLVSDDWTYPVNMTFAVTNPANGTVSLLSNRIARFTLATNLSGDIGFAFTARDEGGLTSNTGAVSIGVAATTYVWTNPAGGAWSAAASWSNGVPPVSSYGARVEFFSGRTLGAGTISASNNLAGTLLMNALSFAGSSSTSVTLNISGNPLRLAGNGDVAPVVVLDSYGAPFVCNVSNAITLSADTTFIGNHSGTFAFAGVISGAGGFIRSNTYGTLVLAANNAYAGATTVAAGTLQIGNGGSNGTAGAGAIVNDGTLRLSRLGTWSLPNDIFGTGSLVVAASSGNDVVELTGANTFSGPITINGGSLRITEAAQLGSDEKAINIAGTTAALRLDGSAAAVELPDTLVLTLSNPSNEGALVNEAGDNLIAGDLRLGGRLRRVAHYPRGRLAAHRRHHPQHVHGPRPGNHRGGRHPIRWWLRQRRRRTLLQWLHEERQRHRADSRPREHCRRYHPQCGPARPERSGRARRFAHGGVRCPAGRDRNGARDDDNQRNPVPRR